MTGIEKYEEALRACWKPRDTRVVWKWAEGEVNLSLRQTESPGPYSTILTPYVREPLSCFADDRVADLVLCWGTQTGKTSTMMVGAAWRLVNRPAPALWVMPSEDLASSFSDTRWLPMVDDCQPLAMKKHPNKRKVSKLAQDFVDCTLHFVGSNSPANLSSRPISLLLADETDKFAAQRGHEAGALHLAENRTKSFANPLRVKTSTPTTEDGAIWQEFLRTDQRFYYVPCPHCSARIRLEWSNVRWDQTAKGADGAWDLGRVRISAHYKCQECGGEIHDGHKSRMLRDGVWVPTNESAEPGRRGYHLNSLYAPWRSCGFGALAVKFLQSQNDRSLLQDFTNSTMAMPWQDQVERVRDEALYALRGDYDVGHLPVEPALLVLTADPGEKETHWAVHSISPDGQMHMLEYGSVMTAADLLGILREKRYTDPAGKVHKIHTGIIDSGYQTEIIYRICAFSPADQKLYPSRGVDATGRPWHLTSVAGGAPLYVYSDFVLKSSYYLDRIARRMPPLLHWPRDVGAEWIHGNSGQVIIQLRGKGRAWRKLPYDHYGDCGKLAVLAFWASADAIASKYRTIIQGIPEPQVDDALTMPAI